MDMFFLRHFGFTSGQINRSRDAQAGTSTYKSITVKALLAEIYDRTEIGWMLPHLTDAQKDEILADYVNGYEGRRPNSYHNR